MKSLKLSALPALAMLLVGCSAAGVLNGITPSGSFDRDKDIRYGDGSRQTMDLYRAATPRSDAPVIVFVHGGGWNAGDKSMYKFVAEGFTKDGYDVAVPNYRLWPDMTYPDMVVDTGLAVQYVARRFPGRSLVLIGHSAGAYNVLQTVVAPDISSFDMCTNVAGVVALAAPTGVYPVTDEPYISIFPEDRLTARMGRPTERRTVRRRCFWSMVWRTKLSAQPMRRSWPTVTRRWDCAPKPRSMRIWAISMRCAFYRVILTATVRSRATF